MQVIKEREDWKIVIIAGAPLHPGREGVQGGVLACGLWHPPAFPNPSQPPLAAETRGSSPRKIQRAARARDFLGLCTPYRLTTRRAILLCFSRISRWTIYYNAGNTGGSSCGRRSDGRLNSCLDSCLAPGRGGIRPGVARLDGGNYVLFICQRHNCASRKADFTVRVYGHA